MGHQHKGNYSAKHPAGTLVAEPVLNALKSRIRKGAISCKDAHAIASDLSIPPQQVGVAIDLCEARIIACQLGLFNNDDASEDDQKALLVKPDLKRAIQAALTDNRLACIRAWQIAETHHLSRVGMGKACEIMGVKIYQCQLGAF